MFDGCVGENDAVYEYGVFEDLDVLTELDRRINVFSAPPQIRRDRPSANLVRTVPRTRPQMCYHKYRTRA